MKYKFKINKQKRICDVLLVIFLLLIYFLLGAIKVSPPKHIIKNHYKEIDWTIFDSKKPKNISKGETHSSPASENKDHSEILNIIIPSMDFLENEASSRLSVFKKKSYSTLKVPSSDNVSNNEINIVSTEQLVQLPKLTYNNKKSSFISQDIPNTQNIEGPSIKIDNSQHVYNPSVTRIQDINRLRKIPDEKAILEPKVVKIEIRPKDLKKEEKDISPIISELIIWMKKNHTPFSAVVKKFMNFEKGNLTSRVKFNINNKIYELYLLCKENILEVRICLVEKDKSILLIDSGFKERSNYFREGEVIRTTNDQISTFVTRQKTPSKESTDEFYQIFLSWWDTIKK